MKRILGLLGACALGLGGCAAASSVEVPREVARSEEASATLARLGDRYWETLMARYPTWATYLGDRRYDAALSDPSEQAVLAHLDELRALHAEVRAIDPEGLTPAERITWEVLDFELASTLEAAVCRSHLWSIDQLNGPQVTLPQVARTHTLRQPEDAWTLLARYRAIGGHLDAHVANLRRGLELGYSAPRINVERVIRQVELQLEAPIEDDPYLVQALARADESQLGGESIDAAGQGRWREEVRAAVEGGIRPGLARYLAFLVDEALPASRQSVGVGAVPDGALCYEARIRASTGLDKGAEELHALGLAEVARIKGEMLALVAGEGDAGSLAEHLQVLGTQGFGDEAALLEYNRALVARAEAVLPQAFGRLPKTPVEVTPIESFRAADAPMAYYYGAPLDGSRPAYYYVNTHRPETRPRYTMAVLAYHEAVPGHHLQIALASENGDLPRFQREVGQTAFVEGWALYSEALAWELGLYHNPQEQLGALAFEMWRAVRLVVDTGMHARGWGRQEALDYLIEHTGKHTDEAANEIDRYIAWPGQALAYKVGQLEILALRTEAQAKLGASFELSAFHDELLRHGAIPLETLRRLMRDWIEARRPR